MRVTHRQVEELFTVVVKAAEKLGLPSSEWKLYRGQSFYSIVKVEPDGSGHMVVVSYIGNTAREAHNFLWAMAEAYWLLLHKEK